MNTNHSRRTIVVESDANEILRRIERVQEEQAKLVSENRDDITRINVQFTGIQQNITQLNTTIQTLAAKFDEYRRPNWPFLGIMVSLIPICVGGLAYFMSANVTGSIAPVQLAVVQTKTDVEAVKNQVERNNSTNAVQDKDISALAQGVASITKGLNATDENLRRITEMTLTNNEAGVTSRADREQLNRRLAAVDERLGGEIADRRSQSSTVNVQLAEVEQQFHSISNLRNLDTAWDRRIQALIWERVFPGSRWPSETFYPTSIFQGPGGAPPIDGSKAR